MPLDRSKLKKIYNTLLDGGYEQSYEEFERAFEGNNYANRKKVYDLLMDNGGTAENLGGSYEEFMSRLYFKDGKSPGSRVTLDKKAPAPKKAAPLQANQPATEDKTTKLLDSVQSTLNENRRVQNRMDYAMGKTGLKTPETNLGWKGKSTLGFGGNVVETKRRNYVTGGEEKVYLTESGNEYGSRAMADVEQGQLDEARFMRENKRAYLMREKERIEREMNQRRGEVKRAEEEKYKKIWDGPLKYLSSMPRGGGVGFNPSADNLGVWGDKKYKTLNAQLKQVEDALATLDEAEAGKKSDAWIADSSNAWERNAKKLAGFGGGAWRGLAHSVGKISTWDFGITDMETNKSVLDAANAVDKGTEATKEDQELLDLVAYKNMVEKESEPYLGYGYTAGSITGESLPFMLEMAINPASGVGKGAMKASMRGMLKKYGKEKLKSNFKKYLLAKAGARVAGDVAGAHAMALTTGQGRVIADTMRRLTGDVQYGVNDNGQIVYSGRKVDVDGLAEAYLKSFESQAIENHSEMLGEYFAPLLTRAGKAIGKPIGKGLEKLRLGGVNRFIEDVGASKTAKLIDDFSKKTQWNGSIGEYAEEVAGGIENAMIVGDQTLDTDEQTGVFNLEKNIETFLGVGLMGGFMFGAKLASYRGPKRGALQEMEAAGNRVDRALGGKMQARAQWGEWRSKLLLGNAEEKKNTLREIMDNEKLPIQFRNAVADFSRAAQKYEGLCRAEQSKRLEGTADPVGSSLDDAADAGYELNDPQEMTRTRLALENERERMAAYLGVEVDQVDATVGENLFDYVDNLRNQGVTGEELNRVMDYARARSRYEGMQMRLEDDTNTRIDNVHTNMARYAHRENGTVQTGAVKTKDGSRPVWIVSGNLVFEGEGKNRSVNPMKSDESIFVIDAKTGQVEMHPATDFVSLGEPVSAEEVNAYYESSVREQMKKAFEANTHAEDGELAPANETEGAAVEPAEGNATEPAKPAYEVGDVVTLETEDGPVSVEVQAVTADGVEVRTDEPWRGQVVQVIPTEEFEGMMKKPVEEAGVGVEESSATESNHYTEGSPERVEAGDNLIVTDEEGNDRSLKVVRRVSMRPSEKGGLEPQEDANGKIVELVDDATGETVRMWDSELAERTKGYMRPQQGVMPSPKSTEGEGVEQAEQAAPAAEPAQPKRNEIPVDEKTGEPVYEAADPGAAWDALVEEAEGDEELAMETVNAMVRDMEEKVKKAKNAKLRAGATAHEKMEAQKERKRHIAEAEERLESWKRIAGVKVERAAAAEASVVESPVAESPAVESPAVESPAVESPAAESPAAESPAAESPVTVETPAAEDATLVQEGAQTPVQEGARGGVQVPHSDSAGQEATQDSVTGTAPVAEQTGTTPKGVEAIPTRKNNKGEEEVLYHKVPVARTMADLYDGGMDQEEIDGFVEANSAEAAREVKRIEGKKPKMTTNKAKYMEAKRAWQAELDEAREKEAYWKEVGKEVKRVTHRDEAPVSVEGRGHEAALGEDMPKDEPMDVYEVVASALGRGRIKITPESFRAETGYSVNDQKKYPGMVASAENGGVSVERAAEMLMEDADMAGFPSDDYTIRQAIIDVLQDGHPAGYISRRREEARRRAAERDEREREEYYQDRYGMNADDGMAYEETAVPNALNQYGGVSEDELAAQSAEAAEAERMKREEDEQGNRAEDGGQQMAGKEESAGNEAASEVEEMPAAHEPAVDSSMPKTSFTQDEAADFVDKMEARAESVPEMELTIENWDSLFGEDGRVETPIGEVKMGENQFAKLMRQGRNGKLGMIKPTLESPDIIIEQASMAKEGDVTERPSSYLFIKAFTKPDGGRFYYFTSVSVSRDGKEVIISNQEKSRNKILRLMTEESVIWRTPNDAATSSAEKQGLDYAHPNNAEDETKGSGITPQSTSSAGKVTESKETEQVGARDKAEDAKSAALTLAEVRELAKAAPSCELDRAGRERVFDFGEIEKEFGFDDSVLPSRRASVIESAVRAFADGEGERRSFEDFAQSYHREEFGPVIKDEELRRLYDLLSSRADRATSEQRAAEAKTEKYGEELMLERLRQIDGLTQEDIDRIYKELQALQLDMTDMNHAEETEHYLTESHLVRGMIQGVAMMEHELGKVREERAPEGAQAVGQGKVDNQGNPLNEDGSLKVEMVQSVDELTDEDFTNPSRNVQLPALPENIDNAIGVNGKPVVIKKNIFGRNAERHNDLTPAESREILLSALYNPDLYGQNQKRKRPYNWVVINTKDEKGHNRVVLLEVNENKDNVEIVHWHYLDERGLEKIRRQAANEDGQLLILPSEKTEEVGALSDPIHDLSSAGKVTESKETEQVGARVKAEGEEAEVSKDETPKEYKYRRNSDIDTLPDGYLRLGKDERGFDVAFYDHPLSRKEVERFHMGPITESNELVGKVYEVTRGLVTITYRVVGAEDGFVLFTENGSFDYRTLPYYKFMDWVVAKGKEVGTEVKASGKAREARAKDGTQPVSESEAGLRDALVDVARAAGVEVVTDSKEGQRVLDEVNGKARLSAKQKRALETASLGNDPRSLTVVSSATGAKVLNNLDALAASLENSATQPKIFLGQVANALGASNKGSSSQYATFETKNGAVVTIRLANHNASTKRMDNAGRNNAISIVVSPKPNEGVLDDGNAHVVEFYYDSIKLRKADGHPLAEIVRSIQQALYSGEYKDTTGLAERQEVNTTFENLREHRVFHGSGAEFEEFDHSHMGEGEGAQAYGWGTYVTEVEGIGRMYASQNKGRISYKGKSVQEIQKLYEEGVSPYNVVYSVVIEMEGGLDFSQAKEMLESDWRSSLEYEVAEGDGEYADGWRQNLSELASLEESDFSKKEGSHLYTVEIPNDNGSNYLHWEKPVSKEQQNRILNQLRSEGIILDGVSDDFYNGTSNSWNSGETLYGLLDYCFTDVNSNEDSQKAVSEFLMRCGIAGVSYPAEARSGGREDGARNFVLFNEKDAQITDHVRFFKTENGEAYGFTVGGKIYLDPKIATTETAVHELTHLWADMLRKENPKEWKHVVELMKGTPVWDEVKAKYPELKTEDEIADEVLAHYSGRRGAERLRAEQQRLAREEGVSMLDRASAVAAIERVKDALNSFWKKVADLLGIHFKSAEEVADAALADILNGRVNAMAVDEKGRSLAGIHNISEEKLGKALKMGGLAIPSLAVIDMAQGSHEDYGEISLIAPSALIDKKKGGNAGTFSGDAWTPTYPQVERQFSEDGSSQVYDDLSKLPEAVRPVVRTAWNSYMEGRNADGLAYQFLHEKGMAPEIKKMPTLYPDKIHHMIEASEALDGDAKEQAILDAYVESRFEGSREKFNDYMTIRKQVLEKKIAESPVKKGIMFKGMNDSLAEINERGYEIRPLYRFASEVKSDLKRKDSVDADGTVLDAINQVRESDNLSKEYEKWRNELEERYGIKEVLFSGYTPDGSRTYLPHTLENVSKLMKKEGLAAATGWSGSFVKFAAGLMKNVGTLAAIRKQKEKLTPDHDKVEAFRKKWENVYFNLGIKLNPGGSAFDDTGLYRLEEVATKSNPKAFAKKEYGVELEKEDIKQMKDMVNAIREEYPAMYFETKFERPVRLNEFAAAVLPVDTSNETKEALRNAGLRLYEYDSNKPGDRRRATTEAVQAKGIRFQLVGEKGAANMDKAEEATTRLDNLSVAREMEEAFEEKKKRIEKLRKSDSVVVDGNEYLGKYELNSKSAGDYILSSLRRGYKNTDTNELIHISRKSQKVAHHDAENEVHLKSIAYIPQLIEHAIFIDEIPNSKSKNGFDSYRYYVVGFNIGGVDYTVRLTVGVKNGQSYYDHALTKIEKGNLLNLTDGVKADVSEKETAISDVKDKRLLSLLRMNEQENARKIKLATGWERGADGKWRYEVGDIGRMNFLGNARFIRNNPDAQRYGELNYKKLASLLIGGEKLTEEEEEEFSKLVKKFSGELDFNKKPMSKGNQLTLGDYFDADELFAAYPELEDVPVYAEQLEDGVLGYASEADSDFMGFGPVGFMNSLGKPVSSPYKIVVSQDFLEEAAKTLDESVKRRLQSVFIHEIQHLIQEIEGFAKGGSATTYRNHIDELKWGHDVWSWAMEFEAKHQELGKDASREDVYYELVNEFKEDGHEFGDGYAPSREVFDEAYKVWSRRGYDNGWYEAAYNEYQYLTGKFGLGFENNRYRQLAGEVEARNAENRMDMTAEERRASLAEETEDVAREDQVFIMDGIGMSDSLGDNTSFENRQQRAVQERGVVPAGLNDASIKVEEIPAHPYEGRWSEARSAAIEDAYLKYSEEREVDGKKVREPKPLVYANHGRRFTYTISRGSLKESVNPNQIDKSKKGGASPGVHLAVLNHLDKVIANSIEVEEHPDYIKGKDGVRGPENGYTRGMLVHRFVGAVRIDGQEYIVKTTMHEHSRSEQGTRQYAYDVTKIAVLNVETPNTATGLTTATKGVLPLANVLNGFEKSYDPGKNLLEESKKEDRRFAESVGEQETDDASYREVEQGELLDELRKASKEGRTVRVYRTMQVIDGKLYSPMAKKVAGQETSEIKFRWEAAEEHPELARRGDGSKAMPNEDSFYITIDKGQGKGALTVAYNPYTHTSRTVLNDQFSSAFVRPNLVVVEVEVPESELEGLYKAEKAKDSVGEMSWHSGAVRGKLAELGNPRKVILSRYDRPVRILTKKEEAELIAKQLEGTGIAMPYNLVTPQVREELEKLGVKIDEKPSGSVSKNASFGKAEYVTDEQIEAMNGRLQANAVSSPEAMTEAARALSEQLGVPVEIVTDVDSITHPNEAVEVKRRGAKGWYDKRTGKVAIVVPNHLDVEDVAATVFHEVVAHRGLRELVGEQGYDEFLMEVFNHSKADVRERMMALAGKHGWDIPKAVDEYLGGLAERGFDDFSEAERGMWTWLKEKVLEAIDKFIGTLKLPKSVKLGDNELRYLLWRSHENLRAGREGMVKRAMDVAKRYELGLLENEAGERMIAGQETYRSAENRGNTRALPIRERAKAVAHLKPVLVERNEMSKEELRQIYNALPDAVKDGRSISFFHSAFKKNYKEGGLFAQVLPKLNEILKGSVFAYSEKDNRGGEVRPDGTVHKYHPNANAFDNYVGKVEIDGKEYYVRITVQEQQGQVGTHSFFVTSVDVYEKPVNGLSVPNFPSGESDHQRVVDAKLRQFFDEARREDKASEEEDLYRTAYHEAAARDAYERRVKSGLYQSREALQDSMLGLRTAMEEVLKAEGNGYSGRVEDIPGFENAYLGENRLSSVNQAEVDEFGRRLFKPLLEIAASFGSSKEARQALTDYMMAKHGLERNALMRERAKKKAMEELDGDKLQKKLNSIEKRDFAGLTALTGEKKVADAEQAARKMVADFEQASGQNGAPNRIAELWKTVRGVTGATLKKMKDSGLITKEQFDEISGMYDFYIPLRGFDGQTAEDVYDYLGHGGNGSAFTSPIKKAEGRKSKADDPFAYMAAMAESAIMQGNRNVLVKQKFLNFVLNHPSDLVSVSDLWLRYDAAAGEWRVAQSGDIAGTEKLEEGDSPEEVERKMAVFEERMQAEAEAHPKEYKRQKEHPEIPYRVVEKQDLREHQVIVKRNGRDYVLTINGSPRAAQALNGLTNPNLDVSGVAGTLMNGVRNTTNYLSQVYTTRNPNFVGSNWARDAIYSNIMAGLKEDGEYGLEFSKAWLEANPVSMSILYSLYEQGELDMNNEKQRLFAEFMANGGETGYMSFRQIEERKNEIERQLKLYGGKMSLKKGWSDAWNLVDYANRVVENQSRFAAYMASRRSGRTIDRSIYDAKEITVNFNKKGAGSTFYNAKNQTLAGKVAGGVSGIGRFGFAFWNAAIQGTTNFARFVKRNPKKGVAFSLATMALGYVVPLLASIFHDDDDDKEGSGYFDLPDAVRRDNFVFRFPGMDSWITIPLPVEYRALYGLGELTATAMYRASIGMPMTAGEIAGQAMGQISQLMPLDLSEGGGMDFTWGASGNFNALAPSAVKPVAEAWTNKSWTGLPVYKDTPYNKQDPEWTKAFKNTNTFLVKMCKQLNEWTGGDSVKGGAVDLNPAVMEHLLKGYLGGIMQTADQSGKLGETVFGDRKNEFRNWPVVSRFLREGDERTKWRAVTERYFNLKKEAEETDRLLKRYKKLTELGDDHQADIDELVKTDAYKRMEVYDFFENDIRKIQDVLKRNDLSEEEREQVEGELNEMRLELLKAVDELGNLTGLGTGRLGAVTGDLFAE